MTTVCGSLSYIHISAVWLPLFITNAPTAFINILFIVTAILVVLPTAKTQRQNKKKQTYMNCSLFSYFYFNDCNLLCYCFL